MWNNTGINSGGANPEKVCGGGGEGGLGDHVTVDDVSNGFKVGCSKNEYEKQKGSYNSWEMFAQFDVSF